MTELLLAIDIGTASTKGLLVTPSGEIVAQQVIEHRMSLPRPGWAEHNAETIWWGETRAIARRLAEGGKDAIAAVCVSGVGPCLLPCDGNTRPLRPAILYGIDSRAQREIDELDERLGRDQILARSGSQLTSQAIGPKLLWLRRNEPEVWATARGWYMPSSFAIARLCGEYVLDHHSASQCDPMYELERGAWTEDWARELTDPMPLPRLVQPGEIVGEVSAAAAAETGLRAGTAVVAGSIDAWLEALSVGVREPGDVMLMYGSTMFIIEIAPGASPRAGIWTTAGLEPGSRTYAAGMATSGSLTEWIRETVGIPDFGQFAAFAAEAPAGSNGLVILPYFAGERSPLFDPNLRGVIAGLTLSHGPRDLARACYEATAFGVRHNLEVMDPGARRAKRIVAVGGGTKAPVWTQIVSSVTGREQHLPVRTIGAAYGGALLAAQATELAGPAEDWAEIAETVGPDPQHRTIYDDLFQIYRELGAVGAASCRQLAQVQSATAL
jgi:xylulokinase